MELSEEAKAAHAAYMREWRKKNPDKQREYYRRKWERVAAQAAQAATAPAPVERSDTNGT